MSDASTPTLGDVVAVACAELFRGDGAILASPMAPIARLGAQLAAATFAPQLMLTDGVSRVVDDKGTLTASVPFSRVFDLVWSARRHVVMGASQIDRHGNTNISCLGDHERPKVQLLGARGAPGNTRCHPTSYIITDQSAKCFVEAVDFVSGIGPSRGAAEIRGVVTNLAVYDLKGEGGALRLRSLHPGVALERALAASSGFEVPETIVVSRGPTPREAELLNQLDPSRAIRGAVRA